MSTTRICKRCRSPIFGQTNKCPSCGYLNRRSGIGPFPIIAISAIGLILVALFWYALTPQGDTTPKDPSSVQGGDAPAGQSPQPPVKEPQPGESVDMKELIRRSGPSVVRIDVQISGGAAVGSGFVSDDRGFVVTNHHVVTGARTISVTDAKGQRYPATTVAVDPSADLALLKVPGLAGTPALKITTARHLVQGDRVLAFGNPEGLTNTVSEGIVSAVGRSITMDNGTKLSELIQTTAPISHGSSGGPLLEIATGAVVGVTTAGSEKGSNLGFAVPGDAILARLSKWASQMK